MFVIIAEKICKLGLHFHFFSAHVYFRNRLIRPRIYKMHALVTKASSISFMIKSYVSVYFCQPVCSWQFPPFVFVLLNFVCFFVENNK